jgi:sulfur-oxidizing protein SoxZ
MVRVLLNTPKQVRRGQVFEVKLLISHPMESGQRRSDKGEKIPRDIIHALRCTLNGELVLEADLFPAIAANPFFTFTARAETSGVLEIVFIDDHGVTQRETAQIEVV